MTETALRQHDQTTEVLRDALGALTPDPGALSVVSARELKLAAGRRSVIEYVVTGLDPAGPVPVIAKTFTELRRAQLLFEHLEVLSRGPFATGDLRVPQPLALLPREHLVLYQAVTGRPVDQLADGQALAGVRAAARWLVRLHSSNVSLPRTFDTAQEVASTQEWAAMIGRHHPDVLPSAQRLASHWAESPPAESLAYGPAAYGPIHKDFHAGHVLVDAGVGVIDLDEARLGHPAFDVAHFCTYLDWQGDPTGARCDAFLAEYRQGTGWTLDGWYARYQAYTWLKIAKQLARQSAPGRAGSPTADWEVHDAVTRGIACLAR